MSDRVKHISRRRCLELTGLAGAVGLAGCAGSDNNSENSDNANDGGDNQNDQSQQDMDNAQDALTVWAWNDQALEPTRAEQAEAFEEQTGTPLEWQYFPWDNYLTKLQSSMAGGNAPNSFALATSWIPQMADNGAIAQISTDEFPEMIDAAKSNTSYDGNVYSVPWYADCRALCLNVDAFEEAGLEVPQDPTQEPSWDQFASWVNELSTGDRKGYVMAPDEGFEGMMLSNGGRYLEETDDGWRTAMADDEVVATANYFLEDLNLQENILLNDEDLEQFLAGNAAMTYAGSWELDQLNKADVNYMYVPHPTGPNSDSSHTWSAGVYYSMPSNAPDIAKKWMNYVMSEEVQMNVIDKVGGFPGRADIYETDEFQQVLEGDPVMQVIAQEMRKAIAFPRIPDLVNYLDIVRPAIERVWQGQADPAQAFEQADKRAQAEIDSVTQT